MGNPEVQNNWETIFEKIKEALDDYGKTFFEEGKIRQIHLHFAAFQKYQQSIPTYGAIMLNEDMSKVSKIVISIVINKINCYNNTLLFIIGRSGQKSPGGLGFSQREN